MSSAKQLEVLRPKGQQALLCAHGGAVCRAQELADEGPPTQAPGGIRGAARTPPPRPLRGPRLRGESLELGFRAT